MISLEETLREVERLKKDLDIRIVVQEEEGHYEEGYTERSDWNAYYRETGKEWIVDKPRITEPDTEKRESTMRKLQQIYNNNQWYSARYKAGMALLSLPIRLSPIKEKELDKKLILFIEELLYKTFNISDKKTRKNAKKDLRYLYKNLPDKNQRIKAGKALGYSRLRIWLHELF